MRAHMNCVENLPLYTALVLALAATGVQSATIDHLAMVLLAARIGQTLTHIMLPPTNPVTGLRFGFFCIQAGCMVAIAAFAMAATLS